MEEGEEFDLTAERATPLRYGLALLALATEVSQAVTNFLTSVTVVTARHVLQQEFDHEFKEIVKHDDSRSLGSGAVLPQDGPGPGTEAEGTA